MHKAESEIYLLKTYAESTHPDIATLVTPLSALRKEGILKRYFHYVPTSICHKKDCSFWS